MKRKPKPWALMSFMRSKRFMQVTLVFAGKIVLEMSRSIMGFVVAIESICILGEMKDWTLREEVCTGD